MRDKPHDVAEKGRVIIGYFQSPPGARYGAFFVRGPGGHVLKIIAADGEGWEHVSVSREDVAPTWDDLCFVKRLFWREDEWFVQFHPAAGENVNHHPRCRHLWKPVYQAFPTPPAWMVGPKKDAKRHCRACGCTDDDCRQCIEKTGKPCSWVETDLCSACVPSLTA